MSIPEILTDLHAAFKARDMETIGKYFADDVHYVDPNGELHGRNARLVSEQVWFDAFDEGEVEVTSLVVQGNEAMEACVLHGVHTGELPLPGGVVVPPTNNRIKARYVVHYRFDDDRIVFQEVVFDRLTLMQQLQLG